MVLPKIISNDALIGVIPLRSFLPQNVITFERYCKLVAAEIKPLSGVVKIDEKDMRQIMGYLRIDDHDIFVGYIRKLGIEHED
jgi:hypothetical protein